MPSNFTQALPTQSPTSYTQPEPPSQAGPLIAQSVATVAESILNLKKQSVLGALAAEAQGVVSESARFQKVKDDIISRTVGADQATFNDLANELRKIRNGERQGVISPGEANIRLQSLARTYINRYPRMAGDIRKVLAAVSGDITPETKTGDISDPFLKEQYELVEEATAQGTTVDDIRARKRLASNKEKAQNELEIAQAEGAADIPKLMTNLVDATSQQLFGELISGMVSRIKQGTFVKENELTGLRTAHARAITALEAELSRYELETGRLVDHKQFTERMDRAFNPLIALASEADSLDKQLRFSNAHTTIMKNNDYAYYHNVFGALGPIVLTNPEVGFKVLQTLATVVDKLQRGQYPSWEVAAQQNPEAALYLSLLKRDGQPFDAVLQKVKAIVEGRPSASIGPDAANRLAGAIALETAALPGTPMDEAGKTVANYVYSQEPIDALIASPNLYPVIRQSTEAQAAIEDQAAQQLNSFVFNAPLSTLRDVKIDPNNLEKPFSLEVSEQRIGRGKVFNVITTAEEAKKFNDYYRLMLLYKDPAEASAEVIGQFQTLVAAKTRQEMEALASISTSQAGGPSRDRDAEGEKGETVTQVGPESGKHYTIDENGVVIDLQKGRVIPDTYDFSPKELADFYRDVPIMRPAGADTEGN